MFAFIGQIFSFAFSLVRMGLSIAWGALEFVLGLLGGIFTLVMSLGGFLLASALVLVAIIRRKDYKAHKQAEAGAQGRTYDVDAEEFTSFYDQFRQEQP